MMNYECIIIGGGIAGLQAAVQLGRYEHQVLVIDSHNGRSSLCRSYHNILGWPDGISGETLRSLGTMQAKQYGVHFQNDKAVQVKKQAELCTVVTETGISYTAQTVLLATGVMDRLPDIPHMRECLGLTIYVCPDCDGYEVRDKHVIVLGSGNTGAEMALTLTYWTKEILYINHDQQPISQENQQRLEEQHIVEMKEPVKVIMLQDAGVFGGVQLQNGQEITADRAFVAFGGNHVRSELAEQLGAALLENGHILTDPRTKETNIKDIWVAGDVAVHSEQVTIAMGEGAQAAIWIHKRLLEKGAES